MTTTAHRIETGPIAFVRRRLSPKGYLGLHLTLGLLVLVLACSFFAEITEDVVTGDSTVRMDENVATYFHAHASSGMTKAMFAISFFGSTRFLAPATALLAFYYGWRRNWHRTVLLLLVVGGGALVNLAVKQAIHRHRPVFTDPIATLTSYSFPSGHTMGATLLYGLLALFVVMSARRTTVKTTALIGAGSIIALIALSRIYLGLHYLSDVLGAMAAGAAWLALCVTAMETYRRRKAHRSQFKRTK